jgi:hypothetical protein
MRLMTAVLIDEHVHEKVFNDRIAELLALLYKYTMKGYRVNVNEAKSPIYNE